MCDFQSMEREPTASCNTAQHHSVTEFRKTHRMETLGARIRQARKLRGMSRSRLHELSKVGYSTIAEIENDGMHSTTKLHLLAKALNVSDEWLATGHGSRERVTLPADTGNAAPMDTQAATAAALHDIRVALVLTAKALAASIRPAGSALLGALEESGEPLMEGSFLGELAKAIRAEVAPASMERPASHARRAKARR